MMYHHHHSPYRGPGRVLAEALCRGLRGQCGELCNLGFPNLLHVDQALVRHLVRSLVPKDLVDLPLEHCGNLVLSSMLHLPAKKHLALYLALSHYRPRHIDPCSNQSLSSFVAIVHLLLCRLFPIAIILCPALIS